MSRVTKKKSDSGQVIVNNGCSSSISSSSSSSSSNNYSHAVNSAGEDPKEGCFVTPKKVFFKCPRTNMNSDQKNLNLYNGFKKMNSKVPGSSGLLKCNSTPVISEKKSSTPKSTYREKSGVLSLVTTPVSHLCSPSLSPKGRRHFIHHNKCSVKRFLSDSSLNESLTNDPAEATLEQEQLLQQEEETSNFVVAVRVRPFNFRELNDPKVWNVIQMTDSEVQLTCDTGTVHSFSYDHCFASDKNHPQYATQETVFNKMVQPLIDQVFQGYNACLLAYGQTGSGKSYSMMGLESNNKGELSTEAGVIPRFCNELFKRISGLEDGAECLVEISYFEIYNEKIHDLLGVHSNPSTPRTPLKVREHPTFGPYVVDLSCHCVRSFQDVQGWLTVGNSQRVTAATGMNEKSSRSHSIFSIMVTQKEKDGRLHSFRSKVNLVDLAGSERVAQSCAVGTKLKEGVSINKSLLSLGKVITFLSEKGKRKGVTSFGPFRESVLTWLLRMRNPYWATYYALAYSGKSTDTPSKIEILANLDTFYESLGGNSRTAMLATISPSNTHVDETLSTLRYACQARSIVNRIHKNEDANERVIRELRAEVEKITALREELDRMKKLVDHTENKEKEEEINRLKKQLIASEELLAKSQQSWSDRLREAETLKTAELQYLKRCGVAIELHWDRSTPCLVNLAADPILTGTLMYLLPPGRVVIGRTTAAETDKQPDIGLDDPLVNSYHCEIENIKDRLFLKSNEGCITYVNGAAVEKEIELNHGDRVVIGVHYFRISNPKNRDSKVNEPVDYAFAHQEVLQIQEKRLREELDASKEKALKELETAKKEAEFMLGEQKSDYERQISEIVSVVEMQKNALLEERKLKNFLEVEKNVLEARVKNQEHCIVIKCEEEEKANKISPYKSTFLKDLKSIFNEGNLKVNSEGSLEEVNLHEMQLMVQEGTQRCRERGINFEFLQQQLVGIEGLQPVVKVIDLDRNLSTLWRPQQFSALLSALRENDQTDDVLEMLHDSDAIWETNEDESNDGSISLNTSFIKRHLSRKMREGPGEVHGSDDIIPKELSDRLDELREKADQIESYCSKRSTLWSNRVNKAMEHFELFLAAIEGKGDSNSPGRTKSSLRERSKENNGKCVRFTRSTKRSYY